MNRFGNIPIPEAIPFIRNLGDKVPLIREVDEFQTQVHFGQMRRIVKETHSAHTRIVATVYAQLFGEDDVEGICAGLAHDAIEDSKKLVKYIAEKFRILLSSISPQGFLEFVQTHVPGCFRSFLEGAPYQFPLPLQNANETVTRSSEDDAVWRVPVHRFNAIIHGASTGERFRHFVSERVKNFGNGIHEIVWLLTRASDHLTFNKAFRDESIPLALRKKAANLKGIDTWHNLETINLEDERYRGHGEALIDRTIEFLPYVRDLMDERVYNTVIKSLTARYEELQRYEPLRPLQERLAIAKQNFRIAMGEAEPSSLSPARPEPVPSIAMPIAATALQRGGWVRARLHHMGRNALSILRRRMGLGGCNP
jgi:hypothetical protein